MSENPEVTAASTGAAAAVAAVQDDQAEAERAAAIELDAASATDAAQIAAEQAQEAAAAAEAATSAAVDATEVAQSAAGTAAVAADEAYSARDDIGALRQEVQQGWQDLRAHLDETFGKGPQTDQPTEVVVTHERADNPAESRSDAGGNGSSGNTGPGDDRKPRHRFGRRA